MTMVICFGSTHTGPRECECGHQYSTDASPTTSRSHKKYKKKYINLFLFKLYFEDILTKSVQKKINLPAAPSLRTARRNISLAEKSNEARRSR